MEDSTSSDMSARSLDRELVLTALEEGYFEVPRRVTLCELAEAFDISDREASKRLVRGISIVLREYRDEIEGGGPLLDEMTGTETPIQPPGPG